MSGDPATNRERPGTCQVPVAGAGIIHGAGS